MKPKEGADKEFLSEAEELVETLGRDLLRYEDAMMAGGKINPDILNGIFRAAHSLKGLAGMFGRQKMSALAHSMENLLDRMRLGKVPKDPRVLDVLFEAVDKLKAILAADVPESVNIESLSIKLENAGEGKFESEKREKQADEPIPPQAEQPKKVDGDTVILEGVTLPKSVLDVLTEYEEFRLLENIRSASHIVKVSASFDLTSFDTELPELMNWLKERGEVITTLPGTDESKGDKINFDLLVGTDENIDKLQELLKKKNATMSVIKRGGAQGETKVEAAPEETKPPAMIEDLPSSQGEDQTTEEESESARSVSRTVRVDIKRLDNLMNIVGELVLEKTVIGNIRDKLRQEKGLRELTNELYKTHRNLERKLAELQEAVMEVRMVPVGQLFSRLGRIVRKAARDENKEIELIRLGGETELDKLIIEELADPLMHIIRNAIDHGIEPPGVRERHGKPRKGTIELKAFQQGNHVVIQVSDDGAGIDPKKIWNKAVKMGLVPPDSEYKEENAWSLMFEPGFTTKEQVSETSGRGVGLDVVRKNIANLSGMIDVESEVSVGTTFTITLPITLAIIQALIVESAGRVYALPLNSVRECHIITPSDIKTIEQREVMELRERTIPLLRLDVLFGHNGSGKSKLPSRQEHAISIDKAFTASSQNSNQVFGWGDLDKEKLGENKKYVIIVGIAEKQLGVIVDGLRGRQDVVIKSLGKILGDIKGVAGATDLGNQETVLILDVADLMSEVGQGGGSRSIQIMGRA
mgnify:CR=1 FL=1